MKHAPLSTGRAFSTTFSVEDGKQFISHNIDMDPHIKAVQRRREINQLSTRASNPNGHEHVARIPIPEMIRWGNANGYSFHQIMANADGAKDKFLKHFLSRDFSKLHNEHVTTKKERSTVTVPASLARNAVDLSGIGR